MTGIHNTHHQISFKRRWELAPEVHYILGQCEAVIKAISNTPIQPDFRQRLLSVSLIKGAQATTAIEGNTLSFEEIERIQQGENLPESREYLQREVENVIGALNDILSSLVIKRDIQLITPELILTFHERIGRDIGAAFKAIPGKFRTSSVVVGPYRAPKPEVVAEMVTRLCEWLRKEFHFDSGQTFTETVLQAIITHLYIAWIHPFSDGNGRTARLLEFYLLLRAGVPDIASHVLSNHYNQTRTEYYAKIDESGRLNDCTSFIDYAVRGFRDGLLDVLSTIQENLSLLCWSNYLHEKFEGKGLVGKASLANGYRRTIALAMPTDKWLTSEEAMILSPNVNAIARKVSARTFSRYLDDLVTMNIIEASKGKYRGNRGILKQVNMRVKSRMKFDCYSRSLQSPKPELKFKQH